MKYCYSCVVDARPIFYFQAWNLISSLMIKANVLAEDIFLNYTADVEPSFLREVERLGCNVVQVERFGDQKYCNKISQLNNKLFCAADCVFLFDTDMIVLDELTHLYMPMTICGKIVDFPNPDLDLLKRIFVLAGFASHPPVAQVDCGPELTFSNNLNGGFYVVPGDLVQPLYEAWKKWATFLLSNIHLLAAAGKQAHVDQVSFALATHELNIRIQCLPRKYNYPAHDSIENRGFPVILHYHRCVSPAGLIESTGVNDGDYIAALNEANRIIALSFREAVYGLLQARDWHPSWTAGA